MTLNTTGEVGVTHKSHSIMSLQVSSSKQPLLPDQSVGSVEALVSDTLAPVLGWREEEDGGGGRLEAVIFLLLLAIYSLLKHLKLILEFYLEIDLTQNNRLHLTLETS